MAAFALHRGDGSFEVQRNGNPFFPIHDLTHYAVESTLGLSHGFYGLVSQGWHLDDFGQPWPRGPLPLEALQVEHVVGLFDLERATGVLCTAEEMNEQVGVSLDLTQAPTAGRFTLTAQHVEVVRASRAELVERWHATPPGGTLELTFDVNPESVPVAR